MGNLFSNASLVLVLVLAGALTIPDAPAVDVPTVEERHGIAESTSIPSPLAQVTLAIGNPNLGIAAYDARTGAGYIMYSEESVHSRFVATPPSQWNADRLIAVIYLDGTWMVDRNDFTLVPFTPRPTDRLVAEVDFDANTISYPEGVSTTINGIQSGFISTDLIITPETWGGEPDAGEFWVQGTEIVIDNSEPTVEIIEGPGDGSSINYNAPLFAWSATDADGTITSFQVDLEGPSPVSFTTQDTLYQFNDLTDGVFRFCVIAQDNYGGVSPETCQSFTVDVPSPNELPTVQITAGPAEGGVIDFSNPLFAWSAEDTDGAIDSFFVNLYGPSSDSIVTANTTLQLIALLNGSYDFCVQARDDAGGFSSPACRSFTVEVTLPNNPPTVQITSGPDDGATIDFPTPLFAWNGVDTDGAIDSFFVKLDGPLSDSVATAATTIQYDNLINGTYQFCVLARDNTGDFSNPTCRSFTLLLNEPPIVEITNGIADGTTITFNNPAFTWSGEDADGTISAFIVNLDGPSPDSFLTASTFVQYPGRQNGDYTFCVQAVDDDDAESVIACRFFTIDVPTANTPPVVTINNGPEEGSTIDFSNPAFSWSGEDTDGTIDSFYVELRGPSFTAFSTVNTFHQFSSVLNGDHEFCIRASDDEQLLSAWACRSFSVFVASQNLPPTVSIENGPAQGDTLLFNNPAFTWTGEDLDGTVDSFLVDLQGPTAIQFTTTATFQQFSALEKGNYAFCIQSKDDLGALSEQLCRDFVLIEDSQNSSPTVSIENGPEEQSVITINNPAFTWIGSDTDGTVDTYNIDLIGPSSLSFSTSDTFYQFAPLASGSYSFCIQAIDNNGALSSWVCRQFEINSAITGTLKDVLITKDGAVVQIPMVQQAIGIYQSDVFIENTTTDGQGLFALQGQYADGNYELRTDFSETIEGIEEPLAIQRTIPITANENLEVVIPRTLAKDQYEILSTLSHFFIPSELLESENEPASLGSLYNVDAIDTLLREWLESLHTDFDLYMEVMQRVYIATKSTERSLGDAAYISHQQAEVLFDVLRVYLTSHEFLSKARAQLSDTEDPDLAEAVHSLLNYIDSLTYEMAINTPGKYAAALSPAPYHSSFFDALIPMFESILAGTVFDSSIGPRFSQALSDSDDRNRFKVTATRKVLTDLYLPNTEDLIQSVVDNSSRFDIQGTFSDAFEKVLSTDVSSAASQSQGLVKNTLQESDSLRRNAQSTQAAQQIAALLNVQSSYASLNSAINVLNTTSFDQSGRALIYTGTGLSKLHDFARSSTILAFFPDSLFSLQTPSTTEDFNDSPEISTNLDEETYLAQLDNILWFIGQGNRDVVVSLLDDIIDFDRQYESSLATLQGDIWVTAEDVLALKPSQQTVFEAMLAWRNESLQHRIKMYTDLLRYSGFEQIDLSALTAQRDSIAQTLTNTRLLAEQLKLNNVGSSLPFVTLSSHQTTTLEVVPGIPSEVIVSVQNTGTQPANQLTLTLKTDSLFTYLSPPSFIIPTLEPGQSTTIRWEFVIQEHAHSGGIYVVEAKLPDEKKLHSSGTYKIGTPRDITTISTTDAIGLPTEHALHGNYPNPFMIETTIRYDLPKTEDVTLTLYDMVGREVKTVLKSSRPAGKHSVQLDSQNLPSGTYLIRFSAGDYHNTRAIVVVK